MSYIVHLLRDALLPQSDPHRVRLHMLVPLGEMHGIVKVNLISPSIAWVAGEANNYWAEIGRPVSESLRRV